MCAQVSSGFSYEELVFLAEQRRADMLSQVAAAALANNPEQNAWHRRLVSLIENVPVLTEYICEWPNE